MGAAAPADRPETPGEIRVPRSSNILAAMERGIEYSAPIGDEVRTTTCIPSR